MSRFGFFTGWICLAIFLSVDALGFRDPLFQGEQNGAADVLLKYDRNGIMRVSRYHMWSYDQDIKELYRRTLARIPPNNVSKRVEAASAYFLGEPYVLGALGEGPKGDFDQKPLYRTDAFDCTTYVSTVLALVESNRLKQFRKAILKVNYKNRRLAFINRNHFISVDWNPVNQANGYIKDITAQLTKHYKVATTLIDRPAWFRRLSTDRIALMNPAEHLAPASLLNMLHADSDYLKPTKSNLNYIPYTVLFRNDKGKLKLNQTILEKIPSGAIIEMVDLGRNMKSKLGTNLVVFHMGFAIKTEKGLMFRAASLTKKTVSDIPMEKYLLGLYQKTKNKAKAGINVQQIIAPKFVSKSKENQKKK